VCASAQAVLSTGIRTENPIKKFTIENRLLAGLVLAITLLLFAGVQMYRSLQEYMETARWVDHTYQVLDALGDFKLGLRDLERTHHSYLLTGDPAELADAAREQAQLQTTQVRIKQLIVDNPGQQLRADTLVQLTQQRLLQQSALVEVYRTSGLTAARATFQSEPYRQSRRDLFLLVRAMEEEEQSLVKLRNAQVQATASRAQNVGLLLLGITLLGMLLLWWRFRQEDWERKRSEAAEHESLLLKQIMSLLPVGMWVTDAAGVITQSNPASSLIWKGESHNPTEYKAWWHATGQPIGQGDWSLTRALASGETIRDELIDIACFDGSRKTIASHAMPMRDTFGAIVGGLAVYVDVTDFKRVEQQMLLQARFDETQRRAAALFATGFERKAILEGLLALLAQQHPLPASALYIWDEWSGRFQCEAAHGLPGDLPKSFALGEGLLGQAAADGTTKRLECATLSLNTGIADFAPAQVLMVPVRYQACSLAMLVLAASTPLDEPDLAFLERLAATLGVTLDNLRHYTDLKLLAERLRSSSEEIALKNQQLEEASKMKSEFLANMSHELRTPLNAIIGFSEVLKDGLLGELPPQHKEYVDDIFTSGTHLLSLINDILDLSKVEAGKMTLELEPLQLVALAQESLHVVREKALAHRIDMVTDVPDTLAGFGAIWLDLRKVKQILYNLLSNAVKFTADGGTVTLQVRRVDSAVVPHGCYAHYLEISVRDTGIGISPAEQELLFRPFSQIDSSLARRYQGTGLGLVMVKRLTDIHGGKVALHSVEGQGSTFTVWLPWRDSAQGLAEAEPQALSVDVPAALLRTSAGALPLALVVEDDDKSAELLRLQLESVGFRVARAATAEAALEQAGRETPDLVTLDINLPGINGWEFLQGFRQLLPFAKIPVVIVSVIADRSRGLSLGANQVLQKPVGREDLVGALHAMGFPCSGAQPQTVLVIDDDPKAVKLLANYLTPAGFKMLSAFGGQQGIEMARRQLPDLIVLDLMMPEVSGFDVVDALKLDPSTAAIPIIILTAQNISAKERALLGTDVQQVMEKSAFKHDQFISEVRQAMAQREH
jgi:signal transduction histidine kinase/DNA-binding response OmpR family regulator/PAS domain-containing protein